jgi:O-antigen/teichoic acid export membrane protein
MELKKIKELITVGSGDLIGTSLSAGFWFFLASQIEPSEYGELQWFIGIAGIFSSIALFGNINTITVYAAKNIQIQSTLNVISLIASSILSLIIILVFPAFYTIDIGILVIAYVINTLAIGDLLGRKQFSDYSKYTIVQKGLTLGLGLLFYHLFGYEAILFALAFTYILHLKRIVSIFKNMKINLNLVKERIGFIINNYIIFLISGSIGAGQVDKIIIAPILGFAILGNYSLSLQLISIMMIFSTIFYKYILTQDSSGINLKKLKLLAILISILMAIGGIILGPIIIDTFFPKYLDTKMVIQIMSINVIPATIAYILQSQLLGNEKSKIVLIGTGISLLILVVTTIILGLNFGIIGIAISLIISSSTKVGFYLIGYIRRNAI